MTAAQPTLDDIWQLFRETSQRFQETERLLKEQSQEADRRFQETERLLKEQSRETELKIKEVTAKIGRLGNRLGDFVEEMVRPAAVRIFQERGIAVHEVHRQVSAKRHGKEIEIDLLVVNDDEVVAIECKSALSMDDVNEHIARLEQIKALLPSYASKRVLGAVTAMVIPENVARYAYRQGLFVLGQYGESVVILNDAQFQPKGW